MGLVSRIYTSFLADINLSQGDNKLPCNGETSRSVCYSPVAYRGACSGTAGCTQGAGEDAHVVTGSKGTRKYDDGGRTTFHPGTASASQRDDKTLACQETAQDAAAIRGSYDCPYILAYRRTSCVQAQICPGQPPLWSPDLKAA